MNCLIFQYFYIFFYLVMQNGNLERRVEETVLSDKFPCRQVRIPATLRHSCNFSSFPWKRESRISKFSDGFWILPLPNGLDSRLRGNDDLEITRNPKQLKPNTLDSRLRGNDGILGFCFLWEWRRKVDDAVWSPTRHLMPSETPSFLLLSATFRHSRENGNLEPQTFR